MISLLEKNYELRKKQAIYIPHWSAVELSIPLPLGASRFISDWGLKDKFVIQYSGNMGLWHDIDILVRVAHALQDDTDFQFLFIGNGIRKDAAMKLASNIGAKNIIWKDFVPLADLPESLSACHVSLISLRHGLEGIAVPCKLYGILASGRAVVAQVPAQSEIALTIEDNNCGVIVETGNQIQLQESLIYLKNNPDEAEHLGRNAFSAYQKHYTTHSATTRLEQHLFN